MDREAKRAALIAALRNITPAMRRRLAVLKAESRTLDRPDFLWNALLGSFSTMGNSRGYHGLMETPANYNRVTFAALSRLSPTQRLQTLEEVLLAAMVRMPRQKAEWLDLNFGIITEMGGLEGAKRLALAQTGRDAKIAFLKQFHGIGDKYARNIWMDVYDPDFHDSIAVDERIKRVTEALGYSFRNYAEHERFYRDIAREASLQAWELDRLLYNFQGEILAKLGDGPIDVGRGKTPGRAVQPTTGQAQHTESDLAGRKRTLTEIVNEAFLAKSMKVLGDAPDRRSGVSSRRGSARNATPTPKGTGCAGCASVIAVLLALAASAIALWVYRSGPTVLAGCS